MKKTFILKYLLLMISLTFLYTTPAFASAGAIVGSVDGFQLERRFPAGPMRRLPRSPLPIFF